MRRAQGLPREYEIVTARIVNVVRLPEVALRDGPKASNVTHRNAG